MSFQKQSLSIFITFALSGKGRGPEGLQSLIARIDVVELVVLTSAAGVDASEALGRLVALVPITGSL